MITPRSTTARRKRDSGLASRARVNVLCPVCLSCGLAAATGAFKAWFGHFPDVQHLVQGRFADALGAGELADAASGADGLLGDLGRLVVAENWIERSGKHRTSLDQLGPSIGRLQALDAALREIAHGGGQQRYR